MEYSLRAVRLFLGAVDRAERGRLRTELSIAHAAAQGSGKAVAALSRQIAGVSRR